MLISIAMVIAGLFLLAGGGELLLRGAVGLATLARVTPAVIGLTVVAAGTSVPELSVSLLAALEGNEDVAVGNVVGSNIFNIALILGIAAILRPLTVSKNAIRLEYPALLMVTLVFLLFTSDGRIGRWEGACFAAIYAAFTTLLIRVARKQVTLIPAREPREAPDEESSSGGSLQARTSVFLTVAGISLLIAGAQTTLSGAIEIGRLLGMTEAMIGLTIVAAGTGLPEVVTSLVASARGREDIAIGNVLGSNLFNILGVLGLTAVIRPTSVSPEILATDNWWMLAVTVLLFPIMLSGQRIVRSEGVFLLCVYLLYLLSLISRAAS